MSDTLGGLQAGNITHTHTHTLPGETYRVTFKLECYSHSHTNWSDIMSGLQAGMLHTLTRSLVRHTEWPSSRNVSHAHTIPGQTYRVAFKLECYTHSHTPRSDIPSGLQTGMLHTLTQSLVRRNGWHSSWNVTHTHTLLGQTYRMAFKLESYTHSHTPWSDLPSGLLAGNITLTHTLPDSTY